ncbi:MAG TPA: DUF454 family protein [Thermoanaerobaculia bacterium]|jgi:hypothetical protein|nr:DUF454 family protein [Thermoanaerobaculia bacterium]
MSRRKKSLPPASESTARRTRSHRKKIWNIALGVFFFLLGVVGILIPVMPQLIFFFLSLVFFSRVSPRLRRAVRRFRKRHPKLETAYQKWRRRSREKRLQIIRRARQMGRNIEERVEEVIHKGSA